MNDIIYTYLRINNMAQSVGREIEKSGENCGNSGYNNKNSNDSLDDIYS